MFITRTIKEQVVKIKTVNKGDLSVNDETHTIYPAIRENRIESYFKKKFKDSDRIFLRVENITENEQLYRISVEDFLKYGLPVNKESDNINPESDNSGETDNVVKKQGRKQTKDKESK